MTFPTQPQEAELLLETGGRNLMTGGGSMERNEDSWPPAVTKKLIR